MDWKYIYSMAKDVKNLDNAKKDELLNTIAWFDFSEEEMSSRKSIATIQISQEIMKYKSEQVEALHAEIEELNIKRTSEEGRTFESDDRSSRSKKSFDSDEQDIKYRTLRAKFRKLQKQYESTQEENEKCKQNIKMLQQERTYLQRELQNAQRDDSASDVSEIVKDQQRNLMDLVQQKNTQITQLLTDIENADSDNIQMRAQLTSLRDEFVDATDKLELLVSNNKDLNGKLNECRELYERNKLENESFKTQIEELLEDKISRQTEFEQFAQEIDRRIGDWKTILAAKNQEIDELKAITRTSTAKESSSKTSSTKQEYIVETDDAQLNVLQKKIAEYENTIVKLQKQLDIATKEMLKTTEILKQVTADRDLTNQKLDESNALLKNLRKSLKSSHARSQQLAHDLQYQETLSKNYNNEREKLIQNIDAPNIKELMLELEQLKVQINSKEKKIVDLVKTYNKLRADSDKLTRENLCLRQRLDLDEDDFVSTKSTIRLDKQHKTQLDLLKHKLQLCEEDKLQSKLEIQKLNKTIAQLSDQLFELGETPTTVNQESVESSSKIVAQEASNDQDEVTNNEYTVLLEENDALRKGLHEILDSIHQKQEQSEIKSETLENLLRALDAKHVAGWYHPAMRLQAELNTIQGSNATLRDQLRCAKEELKELHDREHRLNELNLDTANGAALANLNKYLMNILQNCHVDDNSNTKLLEMIENNKKEFYLIQEQLGIIYNQYAEEKEKWENDLQQAVEKMEELSTQNQANLEKLNAIELFNNPSTDEQVKIKRAVDMAGNLVLLNRKIVHLENVEVQCKNVYNQLRHKLQEEIISVTENMNKQKQENVSLKLQLQKLEDERNNGNNYLPDYFTKLQNDYDNLLIKQRDLQRNISQNTYVKSNECTLLEKRCALLEMEKVELMKKLQETPQLSMEDPKSLQKRLAQAEINEATEKQRANHVNSLYELVKDQLAKAEERHKEFQKYNNEIMHKNIELQESIKQLEDRILSHVDAEVYKALEMERNKLIQECNSQKLELSGLRDELNLLRRDAATKCLWTNNDQYELHSLRHMIVDLQATTDDKAVIARLSADVVSARTAESEVRTKLDEAVGQIENSKKDYDDLVKEVSLERAKSRTMVKTYQRKISDLEVIIKQQRHHFLGYIPYTCEEKLVNQIFEMSAMKNQLYTKLSTAEQIEQESNLIKETLNNKTDILNELNQMIRNGDEQAKLVEKWFVDKTHVQLQELRYRRQAEFKESQLKHIQNRLREQDDQIAQLEAELLQSITLRDSNVQRIPHQVKDIKLCATTANVIEIEPAIEETATKKVETNFQNVQTQTLPIEAENKNEQRISEEEFKKKNLEIQQMHLQISELETSNNLLRQQIADKQSQVSFYEKHIMEMQQNLKKVQKSEVNPDVVAHLQKIIADKDQAIFELQSLLKKDRDEHSLAAVRFQEELKQLQIKIRQEQQQQQEVAIGDGQMMKPARVAIEFYIQQVHALEKLTSELQTSVSTLNTQLISSRDECARWTSLANDRLKSVDDLRAQLEEQHRIELEAYKNECEKWRSEVGTLQMYINTYKKDIIELRPNIEKELKDKDNRIHELLINMRQLKTEIRRKGTTPTATAVRELKNEENFEEVKENLLKEQEILRKRCETLLNREKSAREEIRSLKGQLMKRPIMSARSDCSSSKEQYSKKVQLLEKELEEVKEKLEHERNLNEAHKVKVNVDFEKWSKQKYWQQTADKLKIKLKEKTEEHDKLQSTCSTYRMLIERLEREKNNMEVRIKNMKGQIQGGPVVISSKDGSSNYQASLRYDWMESENAKLVTEINLLKTKLEQQQHHSGALSSVMLQDKLEAQERKIAVLEMSAKGGGEVRAELERLQNLNATLQKCNLRLEAENLELRLDLEKSTSELPHLREQINYLENYIDVLKAERPSVQLQHEVSNSGDHSSSPPQDTKRATELERTVFVLKRVVEKLQVENKRLGGGSGRPCTAASITERIKKECDILREQYNEKISTIEKELEEQRDANQQLQTMMQQNKGNNLENTDNESNNGDAIQHELQCVKAQLKHKCDLLERVKVLLERAALKEKALLEQIRLLKSTTDSK